VLNEISCIVNSTFVTYVFTLPPKSCYICNYTSAAFLSGCNPARPRALLSAFVSDLKSCGSLVFTVNIMFVMHLLNVT
jgi:hypothetical protein